MKAGAWYIWIEDGSPVGVELFEDRPDYREGALFSRIEAESERNEPGRMRTVLKEINDSSVDLTEALLEAGLIDEVLKDKLQTEYFYRCLVKILLFNGDMIFQVDVEAPEEAFRKPINLFEALFYFFKNYHTPQHFVDLKEKYQYSLLMPNPNFGYIMNQMTLPSHVMKALESWTSPRGLSDIPLLSKIEQGETVAILSLLELLGTLDVTTRQNHRRIPLAKQDYEIVPPKQSTPTPEKQSKKAEISPDQAANQAKKEASKAKPASTNSRESKNISTLKHDIERHLLLLKSHNPLTILGVTIDSDKAALKKAYSRLVKRFHPDRLVDDELLSLRDQCEKLFAEIGNAYQALTDPKLREQFIEALKDPVIRGDVLKLEQRKRAKMDIEKTLILFKQKNYQKTVKSANRALATFPHDPQTLAILAWTSFNLTPKDPETASRARQLLDQALKNDARNDKAHYFKGMMYKLEGKNNEAMQHFKATIKFNPNHQEAKNELRLIQSRLNNGS